VDEDKVGKIKEKKQEQAAKLRLLYLTLLLAICYLKNRSVIKLRLIAALNVVQKKFEISPNMFGLFGNLSKGEIPQGNYAITFDLGVIGDFYLFRWLSFNTGLFVYPDIYVLLNSKLIGDFKIGDMRIRLFV